MSDGILRVIVIFCLVGAFTAAVIEIIASIVALAGG